MEIDGAATAGYDADRMETRMLWLAEAIPFTRECGQNMHKGADDGLAGECKSRQDSLARRYRPGTSGGQFSFKDKVSPRQKASVSSPSRMALKTGFFNCLV